MFLCCHLGRSDNRCIHKHFKYFSTGKLTEANAASWLLRAVIMQRGNHHIVAPFSCDSTFFLRRTLCSYVHHSNKCQCSLSWGKRERVCVCVFLIASCQLFRKPHFKVGIEALSWIKTHSTGIYIICNYLERQHKPKHIVKSLSNSEYIRIYYGNIQKYFGLNSTRIFIYLDGCWCFK